MFKKMLVLGVLSQLLCLSPMVGQVFSELQLLREESVSQLQYLASDQLKGRRTGSEGNDLAARYIAAQLKAYGCRQVPGSDMYLQKIRFETVSPATSGSLQIGNTRYLLQEELLITNGSAINLENVEVVFAGYGWKDASTGYNDYEGMSAKGKMVVVVSGKPDATDPRVAFTVSEEKRKIATEEGALALFEIYRVPLPWGIFTNYIAGERLRPLAPNAAPNGKLVYGWIKDKPEAPELKAMQEGQLVRGTLKTSGASYKEVSSQNVIGLVEGTDPALRGEYLLLSAHYDHVGVGKQGGGRITATDSIFNGARDNAMGVVALLAAARALAQNPPKRSVLLLAVTGEELGLLGSRYYADYPLIPLQKVVYNLNTDGAGYNDTRYVSVIGWNRTGVDSLLVQAAGAAGLEVFPDPAPEQGLFDRSDNVAFAAKGIPCVTLTPGFTAFDDTINKYYHQVADEAESVDKAYLLKYAQAFAITARLLADLPLAPFWVEGDKYEAVGKTLYHK